MQNPDDLNLPPAESELARTLGQLKPAPFNISASQLHTQSILNRAHRRTRLWQSIAALLTLSTALALTFRPSKLVEKIVYVNQPNNNNPPNTIITLPPGRSDLAYLDLRARVLDHGVDAMPPSPASFSTGAPAASLRINRVSSSITPWYLEILNKGKS